MHYRNIFFFLLAFVTITSCNKLDYKKAKSGILYKIYPGNSKDSAAGLGAVLKFNVITKLNDSVLYTSYGKMPAFAKVEATGPNDYSPAEIFAMLKKGDSAVTVQMVDTFYKRGLETNLPPTVKKGDRIITSFKVLEVFRNDSFARADYSAEMKKDEPRRQKEMQEQMAKQQEAMQGQLKIDQKKIEDYLAAKHITTQKTPMGVYVQILNPGQGDRADSGKFVSLKYRGTNFEGKVFDTNMDTSFHHTDPLSFVVASGQMMPGFDNGVRSFKKGGHGFLYIPSVYAYGTNPANPNIQPNENLIFEIIVLDVQDQQAAMKQKIKVDAAQQNK